MKSVLVTGGMGYVGSRLTPKLLEEGYRVRVLDLCLYGEYGLAAMEKNPKWSEWKSRFELVKQDIRNPAAVSEAMSGIEAVIHLAAISNDPTGDIDEVLTRQVNFDAVGVLLTEAKKAGVKRFINASSSSVFGARSEANINETLEPAPITFYSKYKMLSEWIVLSANSPEFCTVNVRPATVCGYSPRQRFDLTVNKLTADAIRKNLITVHGGEQRRPNVGITDMINLYSLLLKTDAQKIAGKTFNFGFENLKIIDIAKLIRTVLAGSNVDIKVTETFDNRDYHISSQKILTELGYKPVSSIQMEVENLKTALKTEFDDIDAPQHYNMKTMKLAKSESAYKLLGGVQHGA